MTWQSSEEEDEEDEEVSTEAIVVVEEANAENEATASAVVAEEDEHDDDDDESGGDAPPATSVREETPPQKKKQKLSKIDLSSQKIKNGPSRSSSPLPAGGGGGGGGRHDGMLAVKSLTIPFRSIKRLMKIDHDIGTVQNEAAIVTTFAVELFVQKLAQDSHRLAKKRGRNTVRYEDVAEARAQTDSLNFLETLLP